MSAASIRAYQAHTGRKQAPSLTPRCFGRAAKTQPPPPPLDHAAGVRSQAAEMRAAAERMLARAAELDESAARMSSTEREAIEWGCIDSDDPRHPNHPRNCVRPCCARREP